jgi:putative transposase
VLETLNSERFADQAPSEVHAALLDEGRYQCSVRTMYRILEQSTGVRERRDQLRHPNHPKPQLRAAAPNQVWSWDITKLLGPTKWSYYYLYVILDIYSRYVVGWLLAHRESAALARRLILETCRKERVELGQLGLHADRGPSMSSKTVAQLLADLGITKTHSRPHVSNDNPLSESQFKTMKYRPVFSTESARSKMGAVSAPTTSTGITTTTTTAGWASSRLRRCTTASLRRRFDSDRQCLNARTPRTLNAFLAGRPPSSRRRPRFGSIRRSTSPWRPPPSSNAAS